MAQDTSQKRSQLFLQSLTLGKTEIPRDMVITTSYIETMNPRSPIIQLSIRDVSNSLANELGINENTQLGVKLGGGVDQSGQVWAENMIVVSPPHRADVLTLNLVPKVLHDLCQPTAKPQFFVDKQPTTILKGLLTDGVTLASDNFQKLTTYHLNMNQKPIQLIRSISAEQGALIWLARGRMNMRQINNLSNQKPAFTYEMNNPQAARTFTKLSSLNQDAAFLDKVRFRFTCYSETEGHISVGDPKWPVKQVSNADRAALQNMLYVLVPKLDVECEGNPALTVGMVLNVQIHRYNSESGIDESVPKKLIIMSVTHHEDRRAYFCRMILGVVARA